MSMSEALEDTLPPPLAPAPLDFGRCIFTTKKKASIASPVASAPHWHTTPSEASTQAVSAVAFDNVRQKTAKSSRASTTEARGVAQYSTASPSTHTAWSTIASSVAGAERTANIAQQRRNGPLSNTASPLVPEVVDISDGEEMIVVAEKRIHKRACSNVDANRSPKKRRRAGNSAVYHGAPVVPVMGAVDEAEDLESQGNLDPTLMSHEELLHAFTRLSERFEYLELRNSRQANMITGYAIKLRDASQQLETAKMTLRERDETIEALERELGG